MGHYAGVGSRSAPADVLDVIERLAVTLAHSGWRLRSGHAPGCDLAFEHGAAGLADIYLPWPSFNQPPPITGRAHHRPSPWGCELACAVHPGWTVLPASVRHLMARNTHQVLGEAGEPASAFVVCWTPDGATTAAQTGPRTGGTGQAIRLADRHQIPVINLARPEHRSRVEQYAQSAPHA